MVSLMIPPVLIRDLTTFQSWFNQFSQLLTHGPTNFHSQSDQFSLMVPPVLIHGRTSSHSWFHQLSLTAPPVLLIIPLVHHISKFRYHSGM